MGDLVMVLHLYVNVFNHLYYVPYVIGSTCSSVYLHTFTSHFYKINIFATQQNHVRQSLNLDNTTSGIVYYLYMFTQIYAQNGF